MPKRKLGNLANLNKHGQNVLANQPRTTDRKRTAQKGNENHVPPATNKRRKLQKTRPPSPNTSNTSTSDNSGHSSASHKSLLQRVLASIVNIISPHGMRRPSSVTSDDPREEFTPFSMPEDTSDSGHHPSPLLPLPVDFETDPRVIDLPHGEDEAYGPAAPDADATDDADLEDEDDSSEPPIPGGPGIPWDSRKPPTEVMALEALEAIKQLLYIPPAQGKRKRIAPTKINGWSRQHLVKITGLLNLYTGKGSNTQGKWMQSSVQAIAAAKGGDYASPYSAARTLRDWARKYVLEREVPVNSFRTWTKSKLETHPELADELKQHLVNISKYVQATDIIKFMNRDDVQARYESNLYLWIF
ncbi:hypothetical protein FB451DRAFT_1479896 [Mycena latifolia]|nr:hypothetical protein FB451DRAFT_1479896 [Mycena latifolia]